MGRAEMAGDCWCRRQECEVRDAPVAAISCQEDRQFSPRVQGSSVSHIRPSAAACYADPSKVDIHAMLKPIHIARLLRLLQVLVEQYSVLCQVQVNQNGLHTGRCGSL